MHSNLATMEANLPLVLPPAAAMTRAGKLLCVLDILLNGSDPGRQTEALGEAVHILPSRLRAGYERER
jgi:hypothetical protein